MKIHCSYSLLAHQKSNYNNHPLSIYEVNGNKGSYGIGMTIYGCQLNVFTCILHGEVKVMCRLFAGINFNKTITHT